MGIVAGIATQAFSIILLRFAVGASSARRAAFILFGIAAFAASIIAMTAALGPELGTGWALVTISLIAYALILWPFPTVKAVGHDRVPRRFKAMPQPPSNSKLRLTLRLISAGPLYLIAALGMSLIIATKPWAGEITRLYTGGLLTPLFWSIGALHATVDSSLLRVLIVPVAIIAMTLTGHFLL